MLFDAALVAETHSWLVKAEKDLRAAQHGLTASLALRPLGKGYVLFSVDCIMQIQCGNS